MEVKYQRSGRTEKLNNSEGGKQRRSRQPSRLPPQVNTVSVLDLAEAAELPLFHNAAISRRLPPEVTTSWSWSLCPFLAASFMSSSSGHPDSSWGSGGAVSILQATKMILLLPRGNLEWTDKSRRRCHIFWKSPAQLGQEIYKYESGKPGNIEWPGRIRGVVRSLIS